MTTNITQQNNQNNFSFAKFKEQITARRIDLNKAIDKVKQDHYVKEDKQKKELSPIIFEKSLFPELVEQDNWRHELLQDLAQQWESLANLSIICEKEARIASKNKRQYRFWRILVGLTITLFSALWCARNPRNENSNSPLSRRSFLIGALTGLVGIFTAGGPLVDAVNDLIEPERHRNRAIGFRSLKIDTDSQMLNIEMMIFYDLSKKELNFSAFYQKFKAIKEEPNRIYKKSYELGINI
jgi:hypothetical protein